MTDKTETIPKWAMDLTLKIENVVNFHSDEDRHKIARIIAAAAPDEGAIRLNAAFIKELSARLCERRSGCLCERCVEQMLNEIARDHGGPTT